MAWGRSKRPTRESCPVCNGDPRVTSCDFCHGDGWVYTTRPCSLTIRWHGRRPPQVGHFLGGRGPRVRTAYLIKAVHKRKVPDRRRGYNYDLEVQRFKPCDVPPGAPGYWFRWDPRNRTKA